MNQFTSLDNFIMQVSFICEEDDINSEGQSGQDALRCVEEQALKMIDFVHSIADFPFGIVDDGKHHEFVRYSIKKAVTYLESLAESYIIVDMHLKQYSGPQKTTKDVRGTTE